MLVNPLHPENALSCILTTLEGIVMLVRPLLAKAARPIFVTLWGMVIPVRLSCPSNAHHPILVTSEGITVFWQPAIKVLLSFSIIALQFPLLSYTVFPSSTVMLVNPLHPENALSCIVVTLEGIVMRVNPIRPENAS